MTTLASNSILAALALQAKAANKSIFSGQVFHIKHYPESTSILVRVKTKDEQGLPQKDGLVVDIRMSKEKHDSYAQKDGLAKNASVLFMAYDIAEHQPRTASNKKGDRSLPAKRDRVTDLPIPGTETPIHRILEYVSESFTVELGAKGCTGPLVLPTDSPESIVAEALTSVVPKAEAPAPMEGAPEVPSSMPAALTERVAG